MAQTNRTLLLIVAVGYLIATVVMTWPLTARAGSTVQDLGDPVFEIWVMRAVQHRLLHDPFDLYHANAFHPFQYTLAYSEEAISSALVAWPVYLISGNDVLAYNWVVLGSFWLLGFAIYLWATELGAPRGAAFVGGFIAAFFPARYAHLSHLHLLVIGWLPLALWALTRFHRTRQNRYGMIASIALAIQLLASLHMAVYATLALGLYLIFLLGCERRPRTEFSASVRARYAAMLIIPYLLLVPTLIPHLRAGDLYGFERARDEVERFSAHPEHYWSVFVTNDVLSRWLPTAATTFFPGFVALIGTLLILASRRFTWPAGFAAVLTVTAAVFSLGFSVDAFGRSIPLPYQLVYDLVPPMRNVRGVARFGLLTGLGFGMLAAFGFGAAWLRVRPRLGRHAVIGGLLLTVAVTGIAGVELRSGVGTAKVPNDPERLELYEWLAEQPDGAVAEFPSAGLIHGPFQPIEYMYYSTRHWKPILAGYSGYIPDAHYAIMQRFDRTDSRPSMVTLENVGILQDLGIRYVIIHREPDYDWQRAVDGADDLPQLERIVEVGSGIVYELRTAEREPVAIRLEPPAGMYETGSQAPLNLVFDNPNENLAAVWLKKPSEASARVVWENADGVVVSEQSYDFNLPAIAESGRSQLPLYLRVPDDPGDYRLRLETSGPLVAEFQETVRVVEPSDRAESNNSRADVALGPVQRRVNEDRLLVDVTWYVLNGLDRDYSGTVQLFDANEAMIGQSDIVLMSESGGTSTWQFEDRVVTTFAVPLPEDVRNLEQARLLVAMYDANAPDLRRAPLLLPDGTVGTELWLDLDLAALVSGD